MAVMRPLMACLLALGSAEGARALGSTCLGRASAASRRASAGPRALGASSRLQASTAREAGPTERSSAGMRGLCAKVEAATRGEGHPGGLGLSSSLFSGLALLRDSAALGPSFKVALALNSLLAAYGVAKGQQMLTTSGLVNAWVLGVILWSTLGAQGWLLCVLYLVCGSVVTKVGRKEKEALGIAEGRGGRRGPENVWGSAAAATLCALGSYYFSYVHPPRAAFNGGLPRAFGWGLDVAYVASIATKLSDTFASEVGKAYGKTTYLITSFKQVPKGTEGAVSLEGTLAGVAGSLVISLAAWCLRMVTPSECLIAVLAAFVATNCESLIGATAQGKVKWMTNEVVNFFNTAIGAAVAFALWYFPMKWRGTMLF